jgi:ubiquinone/menaquinone biosynthesis C-methylase UbiE
VARLGHPIHRFLIDQLDLEPSHVLCDIGCGEGGTLAAAVARLPGIRVLGIDRSSAAIGVASEVINGADHDLRVGDISSALPWSDGVVDRVVCHNVLECVASPVGVIASGARLLRSSGRAAWSHVDCDGLVIAGDQDLGRRMVHAYADAKQPWMDYADARLGRKLPGLVRRAGMDPIDVQVRMLVEHELQGDALGRIDEIATVLQSTPGTGVTRSEVDDWREEIETLNRAGDFFFAEPTVVVVAKPTVAAVARRRSNLA